MLFVEDNCKTQMAAITKVFPKIRSRLTCDFLKLYTDTPEERRIAVQFLKEQKHSPDIFLIQETHLRLSHNFNIANYTCHRNDRITEGSRTAGGTLILVKNSLKHHCLPTPPPLRALEATNIILTPPKHDPISITSVYIPPSSDENLFTLDIEYFIQTVNNCVLFGDFNASHTAWNCNHITNRGRHLYNFANMVNLNVAYPPTPTRFGHNSANTIDIALIKNFYYPFTINSIDDLSSDHNPVFLNFSLKLAMESSNPRAVSTDWNAFRNNLNNNLSLFDFHPNINNTCDLEHKISEFTEAVIETHSHASRPIETDRRNFTPQHINRLLKLKNHLRKRYHQTLNPIFKTQLKKFINEHNLNPNQYGFTNKLSTLHPLLRLTEHISEGFQKRKSTGAVFLDIQKAFDRVWINGLAFKLISYNLPPPLILTSFTPTLLIAPLKLESMRLSNEHSVSAGCPQGSLLGPLLFNLYVNDIPDYSLTKINLYADDTAIHATYKKLYDFICNKQAPPSFTKLLR
ncbi:probable RNA-directed DNA polymerase from transposon X-element [Trichonephila clavipes]|nr:probable RNA-directed DNA polymerase from transposon X-element [Trichonephila clavipes]